MSTTKRAAFSPEQREELTGIKRVLELVDGYASNLPQDTLYAWEGGCMTWAEIRRHIKAAQGARVLRGLKT